MIITGVNIEYLCVKTVVWMRITTNIAIHFFFFIFFYYKIFLAKNKFDKEERANTTT